MTLIILLAFFYAVLLPAIYFYWGRAEYYREVSSIPALPSPELPGEFREGTIYLVPVGWPIPIAGGLPDRRLLERVAPYIEEEFGYRCVITPPFKVPLYAFNWWSYILKKIRKYEIPEDAVRVVAVADIDIFSWENRFTFGYAAPGDRILEFSLWRFKGDPYIQRMPDWTVLQGVVSGMNWMMRFFHFWRGADEELLVRRTVIGLKALLGKSFGLNICTNHRCPMAMAGTPKGLDTTESRPCPSCGNKLSSFLVLEGMEKEGWQKNLNRYKSRVAQHPGDGLAHMLLGASYYGVGRFDEALAELKKASEILPDDEVICDLLGETYHSLGLDEQAKIHYNRALLINPFYPERLHYKAQELFLKRDYDKAIEIYKHIIRLNPLAASGAYYRLCLAYEARGDLDEAIRKWQEHLNVRQKIWYDTLFDERAPAHLSRLMEIRGGERQ